jgi:cyclopropane-fatty-acyl-phospholipid synthase
MQPAQSLAINWVEHGLVPDAMVRAGIRRLLKARLLEISSSNAEAAADISDAFADLLHSAPVAMVPSKANDQHYEIPAAFFEHVLGKHRKYSACYWGPGVETLDAAESAALALTCNRAGIAAGQEILELGCGWGSLTLWIAQQYPTSRVTAVSNSRSQRAYIEAQAAARNITNVRVMTCDMNEFDTSARFDRIVSVEMFEHLRNWPQMFRRVRGWLNENGRFFLHVFVHRLTPYAFVERDTDDWMSRHFFSGGMMPSDDLALRLQDDLRITRIWRWAGTHYERTANAWLANMDANRDSILPVLAQTYGHQRTALWWARWRVFFMSCAELFGYERGQQWWVSHYLFEPRA